MRNNIPPKQTVSGTPVSPPPGAPEMAGYEQLPPEAPPPAGDEHGAPPPGALVSIHDPSLHGDAGAFPVLKAFQDYLETERQQARKRLVTLTVFFVSLMALVIGGFIVAFIFFFNNMSKREDRRLEREDRLLDAALQRKESPAPVVVPAVPPAPSPAAMAAEQAVRQIEAVTMSLQTNLGSQLASVGAVAEKLDGKVAAQNQEMLKLQGTMTQMQQENEKLRKDMGAMQHTLPKLVSDAARAMTPVSPPTLPPASPPTPPAAPLTPVAMTGTTAAVPGSAPAGYEEALLQIKPRADGDPVPWRVFVPSRSR